MLCSLAMPTTRPLRPASSVSDWVSIDCSGQLAADGLACRASRGEQPVRGAAGSSTARMRASIAFCAAVGWMRLHPLVREHALEQREQAFAVFRPAQQHGQRLDRLVGLVARDDFLLAADAAHLVAAAARAAARGSPRAGRARAATATAAAARPRAPSGRRRGRAPPHSRPCRCAASASLTNGSSRGSRGVRLRLGACLVAEVEGCRLP